MPSKINIITRLQHWMDSVPGQTFLNYAYSWGASVVILGALFKLTHLPGGNIMLFLGMGTEVLTFIVNGFERQTSVKESAAPATAGGPVIIGGAPVAAGTVVGAPATNVAPVAATGAGAAPQLDAEAIRIIRSMPNWTPGKQRGEPVRVRFTLPVTFRLQ